MSRSYSDEHARRQQKKFRISVDVDRAKWEALTAERRGEIMRELREMAKREVENNGRKTNN